MRPKIKVLHVIKSLGRGGAETLLPQTLKLHDKVEFEWHYIYFLPWKDQMVSALQDFGAKVTCLSANNNIEILLKGPQVVEYVKKNEIQVIHSHLPWAGILSRLISKLVLSNVPVIYTEHNKQERYHFATRWMNLITMNWQTVIVAVSSDVNKSIRLHKPKLKIPVKTLLNGVNEDDYVPGMFDRNQVRLALGIPKESQVVGTIAVFRSQKRLDLWIETAYKISKELPNVHFVLVGDGPLKDELLKKRKDLGMDQKIHFPGLKTDVRPYLAAFDVYMMSSIFEGLPIALLEAMASGCPVVSTNAGGIKEVVRHNIDGLLCDTAEVDRLPELVVRFLKSEQLRQDFGLQARKRIESHFSMREMVRELEILYTQVFNGVHHATEAE